MQRPMHRLRTPGVIAAMGVLATTVSLSATPAVAQEPAPTVENTPALRAPTPEATAPAALPGTEHHLGRARASARLRVRHVRRTVLVGQRTVVRGTVRPLRAGRRVQLLVREGGRWSKVARARTDARGRFRLRFTPDGAQSLVARVRSLGDAATRRVTRGLGRIDVFRSAQVSWYGPGLYGGHLACGGTLTAGTLGVANKTLPCGTMVTLRHRGNEVRVPVVDRGPYVGAREYDLTSATKDALGFSGVGSVLTTR